MEVIGILFGLGLLAVLVASPIVALIASVRVSRLNRRVDELAREMAVLRAGGAPPRGAPMPAQAPAQAPAPAAAPPPAEPARPAVPSAPAAPVTPERVVPVPAAARVEATPHPVAAPPSMPPPRPVPPGPSAPPPPSGSDFVSSVGPKILVGMGALAFTVFLALFVKYAWDNNWVGPTGRVLSSAVFSLGLLAGGMRLLKHEYRPLGQGLMAAGFAGLYASAFSSHAYYALLPRSAAGFLMIAITASAVVLADRLGARLLATLAWIGGYMMPVLLSTGEDRALALFAYLALLDLGALVLDHRKPWGETVPLAMTGTLLLYGGWYAQFFDADRFDTAAFGLVLFTALFLFGMARKERGLAMSVVVTLAALGVAVLGGGANRPEVLIVLSLGLAAAALWGAGRFGIVLAWPAAFAVALPLLVWAGLHVDGRSFPIAAAWLVGGVLAFAVAPALRGSTGGAVLHALVLAGAGLALVPLAPVSRAPLPVAALLLAWALLAILSRGTWKYSEAVGAAAAALASHAWLSAHLDPARAWAAWAVTVPAAGAFLVSLTVRAVRRERAMAPDEVAGHLATAAFAWSVVYRILDRTQPALLGFAAVALAVVYILIALAGRRARPTDLVHSRVAWGLAAGFVTLAIPVQLGLHGITLGWAVEGLVLLGLGLRVASPLTRGAGYAVLGLAILRLFARHMPLHPGPFEPVLNAPFATWLLVIAALGGALLLARAARRARLSPDLQLGPVVATVAVLLLFGLLTTEVKSTFAQQATTAFQAGDMAAGQSALRQGALAVSVLWTVFATALLAGGLAARSHALFYAAYALFALTAGKVVFVDLGTFPVPYRMLAFLALGLLLMAGAYLNLRFRARLAAHEGHRA